MSRAKHWCFTINNWSEENQVNLRSLVPEHASYLVFGRETGENATPHLQGYVCFNSPLRFTAAKNHIGATAHIEVKRGTPKQASTYCKKDNDFEEFGECPGGQGKRNDWEAFVDFVTELGRVPTVRELIVHNPSLYARYKHACLEIAAAHLPAPVLVEGDPRLGWQSLVRGRALGDPNRRSIDFVVDPVGSSGKSWLCAKLVSEFPDRVQVLRVGRRDDLAHAIDDSKDIFLFDIPRTQMTFLQYPVLEMLKDRMVFSPKYHSGMKILRSVPYVAVFSNEHPDMNQMTGDRYHVIEI